MTDNEIIEKIKLKEETGLSELIDKYSAYVSTIIGNISRDTLSTEDVEELAADVFISVWHTRERLRNDSSLKPYLAQISRNKTISRLRKSNQQNILFDDDILVFSKEGLPDELAIKKEQKEIINQSVENMGEPDKEIFIRFYFFGEKIREISEHLKLNAGTIKTKLHRSRHKIKVNFEERGYHYEG